MLYNPGYYEQTLCMRIFKILNINHYSHSLLTADLEQGLYDDWYARAAFHMKKAHPELEIECWSPEQTFKDEQRAIRAGVRFRIFPSTLVRGFGDEISIPMLRAMRKERTANKIILHLHGLDSYHSILIPFLCRGTPILMQQHGELKSTMPKGLKKLKREITHPFKTMRNFLHNNALRRIDRIYVQTARAYNRLSAIVNPAKLTFSTMGIDFDVFKPMDKAQARGKLGFSADKEIILFVGSLTINKNAALLVETMTEVIKRRPNAIAVIVGGGPERKNIEEQISLNKLEDHVTLAGYIEQYINPSQLPLYYNAADVYVTLSCSEAGPVSLLEAMACDIPVISTAAGIAEKVIIPGKTGLIIPAGSKETLFSSLEYLLTHKNEFRNMRDSVAAYDWRRIVARTYAEYKHLKAKYYAAA